MNYSVLVIGAGAAGLAAAMKLSAKNNRITILEAKSHVGGRAYTLTGSGFTSGVDTGAEFIHGKLPETLKLLREGGIPYEKVGGSIWRYADGILKEQGDFIEHADLVMQVLENLKTDITIAGFLDTYFAGEQYSELRKSVTQFVEGYDAADINYASSFALREEWKGSGEEEYRILGGYSELISYMQDQCMKSGCTIHLSAVVKKINWQPGSVEVITSDNRIFTAEKIIITVPVSLIAKEEIQFKPSLPHITDAAKHIGFGGAIKVIFEFNNDFWKEANKMFFLFSEEKIPTWWTRAPLESKILTGWLAGPSSNSFSKLSDEEIHQHALNSVSNIFNIHVDQLNHCLIASSGHNWNADPFSHGGYSYATVGDEKYKIVFRTSTAGTIYFAGEAYEDTSTVEAAIVSGMNVDFEK